jgi:hypothetical protein
MTSSNLMTTKSRRSRRVAISFVDRKNVLSRIHKFVAKYYWGLAKFPRFFSWQYLSFRIYLFRETCAMQEVHRTQKDCLTLKHTAAFLQNDELCISHRYSTIPLHFRAHS